MRRTLSWALKEKEPALKGPWLAEGCATPLASSVTVPDPTEAPVHEELHNPARARDTGALSARAPGPVARSCYFFLNDTPTPEPYPLPPPDPLPICRPRRHGHHNIVTRVVNLGESRRSQRRHRQRLAGRSEERRVGKEGRSRWSPDH